jgi:hypothetical protein
MQTNSADRRAPRSPPHLSVHYSARRARIQGCPILTALR